MMHWRYFVVATMLLIATGLYMYLHEHVAVPLARPLEEFPLAHKDWRMVGQSTLSEDEIEVLRPTDYLSRRYRKGESDTVDIFISYFSGAEEAGGIHSPKNCMPGSGWSELSTERTTMTVDGEPLRMVQSVYALGNSRVLLLYWFQMRGRSINDEYSLKLRELTNSALYRRRDESFIRILVPISGSRHEARSAGTRFIKDFHPVINRFLPE